MAPSPLPLLQERTLSSGKMEGKPFLTRKLKWSIPGTCSQKKQSLGSQPETHEVAQGGPCAVPNFFPTETDVWLLTHLTNPEQHFLGSLGGIWEVLSSV